MSETKKTLIALGTLLLGIILYLGGGFYGAKLREMGVRSSLVMVAGIVMIFAIGMALILPGRKK